MSGDDEFIIKTVQHKEAEFLQKLLPGYYMVRTGGGRRGRGGGGGWYVRPLTGRGGRILLAADRRGAAAVAQGLR